MISKEDIASINKGMPHCVFSKDFDLRCNKCGYEFPIKSYFPEGSELWVIQGLCWGFAKEHAECEDLVSHSWKMREPNGCLI